MGVTAWVEVEGIGGELGASEETKASENVASKVQASQYSILYLKWMLWMLMVRAWKSSVK